MADFIEGTRRFCTSRRLLVTQGGLVGLGPSQRLPGDSIYALSSASAPLVLRRHESKWLLIGEVYLCGLAESSQIGLDHPDKEPLGLAGLEQHLSSTLERLRASTAAHNIAAGEICEVQSNAAEAAM